MRDRFLENDTPIWLRFNSTTGSFLVIRDRLAASVYESRMMGGKDGHMWIPIVPPFDTKDEALVNALVEDVQAILQVAYPPTTFHSSAEPVDTFPLDGGLVGLGSTGSLDNGACELAQMHPVGAE